MCASDNHDLYLGSDALFMTEERSKIKARQQVTGKWGGPEEEWFTTSYGQFDINNGIAAVGACSCSVAGVL